MDRKDERIITPVIPQSMVGLAMSLSLEGVGEKKYALLKGDIKAIVPYRFVEEALKSGNKIKKTVLESYIKKRGKTSERAKGIDVDELIEMVVKDCGDHYLIHPLHPE